MKKPMIVLALAGLALLVGCDDGPVPIELPEVNDETCQLENIKQIEDQAARQAFAGQCSRRPAGIAPTEKPKDWLNLIDKNR